MIFLTYPSPIQQSARIRNFGPCDYNPELTNTKLILHDCPYLLSAVLTFLNVVEGTDYDV